MAEYRQMVREKPTRGAPVRFHSRHKHLLLACDETWLRRMGSLVAASKAWPLEKILQEYGRKLILTLCFLSIVVPGARGASTPALAPRVVDQLDLRRYVGRWYEIARIPNRFQRNCASNTTADYRLLEDGRIEVTNRCRTRDGKSLTAQGITRIASGGNPARLEVSFVRILGRQLFWGDYWVIGLGENYEWAIVGHPQRKYGWILARKPQLDETTLRSIRARLVEQGYDPKRFVTTVQDR